MSSALFASCLSSLLAAAPHPWLPPYGLDRVGQAGVEFEADAEGAVTRATNPVDLGCILPPHGWLLLGPGQEASVHVAALSRRGDIPQATVEVTCESNASSHIVQPFPLTRNARADVTIPRAGPAAGPPRDLLKIAITDGSGRNLWTKSIPVMRVADPPELPEFGATRLKLRYDAPISVREQDGSFKSMNYVDAWPEALDDVVVSLPQGGRFVFWRGSSYIPFWAGAHNTGLSYEWAETTPPKDGFADCVEPLMDKELRYSRVEILESTAAQVRVRWTYQSCDFLYQVWGDTAEEVFSFTPDGYGTRTLTIQSALDADYELSEFIILTPQEAYPFEVLPREPLAILLRDGTRHEVAFPVSPQLPEQLAQFDKSLALPAVYRVGLHRQDSATAIYFNAEDRDWPPVAFAGFQDQGVTVTPCYWGSHWPLSRGQTTGGAIDERIHSAPSHNSLLSWARSRPNPIEDSLLTTLDALGRRRVMRRQRWTWLIGLTAESDAQVLDFATSFSHPPHVTDLTGLRLDARTYEPANRAVRFVRERGADRLAAWTVSPDPVCVNPVFNVSPPPAAISRVQLAERTLDAQEWRCADGVLWLSAVLRKPTRIQVDFVDR